MFLDLVPAASVQAGLFDAPDSPARQRLMGIIDCLNARHGRDTISFSAIHARYTEAEIARFLASPGELRANSELARFVAWVRTKPDDFYAPTRRARGKTSKWR